MEFDPLASYTREQGARILYEHVNPDILRRILGRDGLGENECMMFYSQIIDKLIQDKEILERRGRFAGGNLARFIQHANTHVTVSEIVRGYEDSKKARRLCNKEHLREFAVRYGGYLWVHTERREEFEKQLREDYSKK